MAWKDPMARAELVPLLGVLDRAVERATRGADQLGGNHCPYPRLGRPRLQHDRFRCTQGERGDRLGNVERGNCVSLHPGLGEVHNDRGVTDIGQQRVGVHAEGNGLQ
jgi:hypothetical protein